MNYYTITIHHQDGQQTIIDGNDSESLKLDYPLDRQPTIKGYRFEYVNDEEAETAEPIAQIRPLALIETRVNDTRFSAVYVSAANYIHEYEPSSRPTISGISVHFPPADLGVSPPS